MKEGFIDKTRITDLKSFYDLMAATREVRARAVQAILDGDAPEESTISSLENAKAALTAIPENGGTRTLPLDATKSISMDLAYEITECDKDLYYLEHGDEAFIGHLGRLREGFEDQVESGVRRLEGIDFNAFITDRDGTTNNYCARYRSSIQSIYNAVFLTRFCATRAKHPVMLTSAPLENLGIMDVSAMPVGSMIYAASKGREFIDLAGKRRFHEIDEKRQALLNALNNRLVELVNRPEFEKFSLIGSGLQFKFGQTTLARQDISGSIPDEESMSFLRRIEALVSEVDRERTTFRIEDTGLDVEIILTIEDSESGLKDFDKGDGVDFLDQELGIHLENGPHLVCGDTASDVPMVAHAKGKSLDTHSIFVTQNQGLASRVEDICPGAIIVPEPDVLVTILYRLS